MTQKAVSFKERKTSEGYKANEMSKLETKLEDRLRAKY